MDRSISRNSISSAIYNSNSIRNSNSNSNEDDDNSYSSRSHFSSNSSNSNQNYASNCESNSDFESNSSYSKASKGTINERKRYKNSIKQYRFFINEISKISSDDNYFLYNKKLNKFFEIKNARKYTSYGSTKFSIKVKQFIKGKKDNNKDEKDKNNDDDSYDKKSDFEENEEEEIKKKSKRKKKRNKKNIKKNKNKKKKEKEKEKEEKLNKEIELEINEENYTDFSTYHNIKVYYINYMNRNLSFNFIVNINNDFKDFCECFKGINNIQSNIEIVYRNEKITSLSSYKFSPDKYDYENDYIIVLELKNTNDISIKTNFYTKYEICIKGNVPHLIIPKENVKVELIKVPPQFQSINIDIYQTTLNLVHFSVSKQKNLGQKFLAGNWKNDVTLIQNILCSNSKNKTYDSKEFVISQDLYLKSGITYIFDMYIPATHIKVNHKKVYSCDYANIIAQKDRMFIIGYDGKSISDFVFMNK